jgi:type IV pilus assembly protein PilV
MSLHCSRFSPASRGRRLGTNVRGVVLIEILVAVVLFSIGVLGLVGLQIASMKNVGESQYRVEAAMLANSLTAQMRTSPAATRATDFASPGGTRYATWKNSVTSTLPGATTTPPSVDTSNYPTVTVTITWRAINDTGTRQYVATTTVD